MPWYSFAETCTLSITRSLYIIGLRVHKSLDARCIGIMSQRMKTVTAIGLHVQYTGSHILQYILFVRQSDHRLKRKYRRRQFTRSHLPVRLFRPTFQAIVSWELHGAVISRKIYASFISVGSLVLWRWLYTEHYCFVSIQHSIALCVLSPFWYIKCSNKLLTRYITTQFWGSISGATFYVLCCPNIGYGATVFCPCLGYTVSPPRTGNCRLCILPLLCN